MYFFLSASHTHQVQSQCYTGIIQRMCGESNDMIMSTDKKILGCCKKKTLKNHHIPNHRQLKMNNADHLASVQYSAGKPWILAFIRMPGDTNHSPLHIKHIPMEPAHLDDIVPPIGQRVLPQKNC